MPVYGRERAPERICGYFSAEQGLWRLKHEQLEAGWNPMTALVELCIQVVPWVAGLGWGWGAQRSSWNQLVTSSAAEGDLGFT